MHPKYNTSIILRKERNYHFSEEAITTENTPPQEGFKM